MPFLTQILTSPLPPLSLSPCSIKEVVVVVAVVSMVMVVGSEVTLVALEMTQEDLARDSTRVEMEDSPTEEGEGRRRHGTENDISHKLNGLKNLCPKTKNCQLNIKFTDQLLCIIIGVHCLSFHKLQCSLD